MQKFKILLLETTQKARLLIQILAICFCVTEAIDNRSLGVTRYRAPAELVQSDRVSPSDTLKHLRASLILPTVDRVQILTPTSEQIRTRLIAKQPFVEKIERINEADALNEEQDFPQIQKRIAETNHILRIHNPNQSLSTFEKNSLLAQVKPFLSEAKYALLIQKLSQNRAIRVEVDLLPDSISRRVGTFSVFKGYNCFEAALAFQNNLDLQGPYINVKRERGYHPAMINYDELWRVLKSDFYQVDAKKYELKYGDLLVFVDQNPPFDPTSSDEIRDFRSIKHASTYLFGEFAFSKASKSANSAYTIKKVGDEISSWAAAIPNVQIKVYRRSKDTSRSVPSQPLSDWWF